jgi:hypothetical protein
MFVVACTFVCCTISTAPQGVSSSNFLVLRLGIRRCLTSTCRRASFIVRIALSATAACCRVITFRIL